MLQNLTIRKALPEDAVLILEFIAELAIYEKAEDQVVASSDDIKTSLFGPGSNADAIICLEGDKPIGYAVYFYNYSTWLGKKGLYLEDLYITPDYRKRGAGEYVLKYLARHAVENQCGRFEWSVLDWNEPAINFYQKIGARPQNEWITYRLTGEALESFAR